MISEGIDTLVKIFKFRDLRNKIFFVLGILVVFRLLTNIPIPGVDVEALRRFFASSQLFGLMNLFMGGTLKHLSIAMLGLGPYITSTIILQLLTMIFPQLEKMYKEEGEAGKQKFNQISRALTIPLGIIQSFAMLSLLQRQHLLLPLSPIEIVTTIITITAGTLFLMWLGELISEKGISNGVSLLIFAGIVAELPTSIQQSVFTWTASMAPSYILFFVLAILMIMAVVLVNEARRNIPVSYAKRVRGFKMYGGAATYLPININPAGVIQIIFALSILLLPNMMATIFVGAGGILATIAETINSLISNLWIYGTLYFILVILFTYFYTAVTFDPKSISENLQKMGGFVPGIRPGRSTAEFLSRILNRILLIGSMFLGLIAIMPFIVRGITGIQTFEFLIGGTALLIVVSVVLELVRQIKAQLQMREYDNY